MSKIDHSPVVLGAGSYDATLLQEGLDAAARVEDPIDRVIAKMDAVDAADANRFRLGDPRTTPGYEFRDVVHPELGVTENIQVAVPPADDEALEPAKPAKGAKGKASDEETSGGIAGGQSTNDANASAGGEISTGAPGE